MKRSITATKNDFISYTIIHFTSSFKFSLSLSLSLYIYIYIERERERERKRERESLHIYIYKLSLAIYHHHHHVALVAQIPLTLSRHSSLSFITLGRSSGQHPVSSHSCWMYVRAGRPAFAWLCVGVHKSTSLMSSSLLLQQCPACQVRLTWIVFVIGGRWPYSWCLVGCCRQVLLYIYIYIYIYSKREFIYIYI